MAVINNHSSISLDANFQGKHTELLQYFFETSFHIGFFLIRGRLNCIIDLRHEKIRNRLLKLLKFVSLNLGRLVRCFRAVQSRLGNLGGHRNTQSQQGIFKLH